MNQYLSFKTLQSRKKKDLLFILRYDILYKKCEQLWWIKKGKFRDEVEGEKLFQGQEDKEISGNKVVLGQNPTQYYIQQSPTFLVAGTGFIEDNFSMEWGGGGEDGFWMILVHYLCCALYSYYYYINSASDHQALDHRVWGSLMHTTHMNSIHLGIFF